MRIKSLIRKNLPLILLVGTLCGLKYLESKLTEKVEREFQREIETPQIQFPAEELREIIPEDFSPEKNREYRELLLYGNPFDEEYNLTAGTFDEYQD